MVTSVRGNGRLIAVGAPVLVAIAVIANGWAGLMPGVTYWDTGEFQVIGPVLGTGHSPGFPTYAIVGFVFNLLLAPLGEPAFRMNVLSLLSVAIAAACLVAILVQYKVPGPIAAVAGFAMATTPLVWLQATRAESHTLHLAFVALVFLVLAAWERARRAEMAAAATARRSDRWLLLAALVFGVSGGNHGLTFLLFPSIGLFVVAVDARILLRPRLVLSCALVAVGALAAVYFELPLRAGLIPAPLVYGRPDTWDGFWYVALATQFHGLISDPLANIGPKAADLVQLAQEELGILAIFVPIAFGAAIRMAPRYAILSGSAMLITLFWNSFFNDGEISRYYLGPIFWAWTWLAMLAALVAERVSALFVRDQLESLMMVGAEQAGSSEPVAVVTRPRRPEVGIAVTLIVSIALILPSAGDWQRRAAKADRHDERSAQVWLDEVMPLFAPNAVVVSWWSMSTPLWYAQKVQGLRPDIEIIDDRTMLDRDLGRAPDVIARYLGTRPVYVIRVQGRDTDELTEQFDMTAVAGSDSTTVWVVNGRVAAGQ